ncbi:choice-of-anchor L domain-containing protein [Cryomorphaceae bacterium]|nr:choice-of-anchor L domain-containing protein [Cryomorphaceae bacterium]
MKKVLLLVIGLCCFAPHGAMAQLVVNNAAPFNTAQYLVENVLVGGGVQTSNWSYTGAPAAIGFFDGTGSNIGIDSGIVITSGFITNAIGPNNSPGQTGANGLPGDPDLTAFSGFPTFDAAILEFDFVPQSDTLRFNYVFGSEEYPEFVGGSVNDVFAFLLTGPDPNGGTYNNRNLANIGASSVPVTINTLNCQNFSAQYICNDPANTTCAPSYLCTASGSGVTIQYDGFTIPMQAEAYVVCGATYTIRMGIADGGDGILDSGVFIEAGSFTSPTLTINTLATFTQGLTDTALIEDCGSAYIELVRTGGLDDSLLVPLNFGGTAINGVDYNLLPDTIIMLPDSSTLQIPFTSFGDGIQEGLETIIIYTDSIVTGCTTYPPDTITLTIIDQPPLGIVDIPDTIACGGDSITVQAQGTGGFGYFNYLWDDGSVDSVRTFAPTATTTYIVEVRDTCDTQLAVDTFQIIVPNFPPLAVSLDSAFICEGDSLYSEALITGGIPPLSISWNTGSTDTAFGWYPTASQTIGLDVVDACGNMVSASAPVEVEIAPQAQYFFTQLTNQQISFTNQTTGATIFNWSFGDGATSPDENPTHKYDQAGFFEVWLTTSSPNGCVDSTSQLVEVISEFYFYVPNAFTPNGDGNNETFGGTGKGFSDYRLMVWNRWGELIYETDDVNAPWDGTFKGELAPQGTYLYRIELQLPLTDEVPEYSGYLQLIR